MVDGIESKGTPEDGSLKLVRSARPTARRREPLLLRPENPKDPVCTSSRIAGFMFPKSQDMPSHSPKLE